MLSNGDDACVARGSTENISLEQLTMEQISNKISNTLSIINTGKKITAGVVQNVSLLWDEERTDFSTPREEAVVRFRKSFFFKVNNRAKMLGMPVFSMWEDAIEVVMGDIRYFQTFCVSRRHLCRRTSRWETTWQGCNGASRALELL